MSTVSFVLKIGLRNLEKINVTYVNWKYMQNYSYLIGLMLSLLLKPSRKRDIISYRGTQKILGYIDYEK